MLSELSIKNLAIIDDLTISFKDGLTILSGETGAGKSIIINAVNLILGNRATSKLIRTGEEHAEIEAMFSLKPVSPVSNLMEQHGFSPEDGLLIRRVISSNDRHKIYINGRMGTIQMLSDITRNLASISGQHANQGLLQEDQHLVLLDQYADLVPLKQKLKSAFDRIQPLLQKLNSLRAMERKQTQHLEFLMFQKNDIENARLIPGEDEVLEERRLRLKHSEMLNKTVLNALDELYRMDGSLTERMTGIRKNLEKASEIDAALKAPADEITDIIFRIEDMAGTLRTYSDGISTDGHLLEETEGRIDFLNKIKRKYGGAGGTLADVFALYETILTDLKDVENLSTILSDLESELDEVHKELTELSRTLSIERKKGAETFSGLVEGELSSLDMKKTRFEVTVNPVLADNQTPKWLRDGEYAITESGVDKAVFMIAPNVGEELKPLSKIASGGELSRVVLALKAILAGVDSVETIVFDEVDAGIGGSVAEKVGEKIRALSGHHQVICITHLPQIAKFGDHHFKIEKTVSGGRTRTGITPLEKGQRVEEMARMLGGVKITEKTLEHAREMLESVHP